MRLLSIALLLATALTAQERRVVPGRFVDPDGKPVANATITAVWTHVAGPGLTPRDVVTTTTNASGRFRLELWPTLAYSVWGVGRPRDDGKRIATRSTRGFVGGVVELEGRAIDSLITVQFTGLDAWQHRGPLTVRGHTGRLGVGTFQTTLDAQSQIELPPAPRDGVLLELLDNKGKALSITRDWLRAAHREIKVSPPMAVNAFVRDQDGKAVEGARVLRPGLSETTGAPGGLTHRPKVTHWLEAGASNAAGLVSMSLPLGRHPIKQRGGSTQLTAAHDDYAGATAGQAMGLRIDAADESNVDAMQFLLSKPGAQSVRVHDGEQPLAGVRCAAAILYGVSKKQRYQDFELQFYGTTDATGSYNFAHIPAGAARSRLLLAIANENGPPTLLPTIDLNKDGPTDVDLAKLVTTELVAQAADGTPAQGAMVVTLPLDSGPPDEWIEPLHCDTRGRATVRAFGETLAFVFNGSEYGSKVLEAGERAATAQLRLKKMPTMQFRIVDQRGQPVEGAMMTLSSGTSSSTADTPVQKHTRRLTSQLNHWLRDRHRADAEGRIRLPFVPPPRGTNTIDAWSSDVGNSVAVPLQATDGEVELVLKKRR